MDKYLIRATHNYSYHYDIELHIGVRDEYGNLSLVKPAAFESHQPGTFAPPFMQLPVEAAQQLMDQLWGCGIRPTEGSGSAGAMAAVQAHLQDMRTLVFDRPLIIDHTQKPPLGPMVNTSY